jgi:fibronectin type 3 domain-containing protein
MGMNQISLSWTAPADNGGFTITSFTLYRSTTSGSGYVEIVTQAGTTYLDTGLTNGVDYHYVVIATSSIGNSVYSLEFTDSPGAVPDMVTNVVAIAGNGQVDLSWDAAEDNGFAILQYNVYRSTTSGSGFVLLASPAGTSYSDNSAVNGVTYYYIITAQNAIGSSINSAEVSALPGTAPTSPVNFEVTEGYDFVYLTWEESASDGGLTIGSYSIYRSTSSGSGFVLIGSTDQLLYNDTDILQGVTYYYQISANNIKGESTLTLELYGTPGGVAQAVDDLVITIGDTTVMLNWTAPADGGYTITGYEVWIIIDGTPELLATTTDIYYLHTGLVNGQEYTYYIIVVNAYGDSTESAEVSGIPVTLADAPQNMNIIHANGSIFLEWTAPYDGGSEIISYKIYRSDLINGTYIEIAVVSGLNYTDVVLNGVQYYYYVVAITSVGTGDESEIIEGMAMTIPDVPTNVDVTIDGDKVTLAWEAPFNGGSDILVYNIYQSYDDITYEFVTNTSSLFFTTVISTSTDYYFKVSSVNSEGESTLSLGLHAYTTIEPSEPQNFVHDEGQSSTKSIYLMWDIPLKDGGEEVTHYTLYKSIAGMELLAIANVTDLFYNDTDLEFGVVYQYQLSAWNIIGESAHSKDVFVPSPLEEEEPTTPVESTTEEPTSETNGTNTPALDVPSWIFPTIMSVGAVVALSAIIMRRRGAI